MQFEAKVAVAIDHRGGPAVTDPQHVASWMVADGGQIRGGYGCFIFAACSTHPNPDECPDDCTADTSVYRATLVYVDTIQPD